MDPAALDQIRTLSDVDSVAGIYADLVKRLGSDPAGWEADLEQFNDPPAGLLRGRILPIGPKADQQVLGFFAQPPKRCIRV